MEQDELGRPLFDKLPNNVGFKIVSSYGRFLLFKDEDLIIMLNDIDELAAVFDDARLWLRLKRHPIIDTTIYSGFMLPPDHPSNFPN